MKWKCVNCIDYFGIIHIEYTNIYMYIYVIKKGNQEKTMKNLARVKLKILNHSQEGGPNSAVHGESLQVCLCVSVLMCVCLCFNQQ